MLVLVVLAVLPLAGAARGADMNVALPIITAAPGDTVYVALNVNPSPDQFIDTRSLEFRLKLGSSVVQETQVLPEGFLWIWGAPYVNAGPDSVLAAAAGPTDMGTTSTLMSTIRVVIKPTAVIPTDLPITFTRLLFNEGNPSLSFTPGVLKIRAEGTGVGDFEPGALALAPPRPNPAHNRAHIAFRIPEDAGAEAAATLELFALDGRCLRREVARSTSNGVGEVGWTLTDAQGRRLHAGLYFVRLSTSREQRTQRLIVMP
jgi:hypothetical protein